MRTRLCLLSIGVSLTWACADANPERHALVGWDRVVIENRPLFFNARTQTVDVAPLGDRHFVVAYIRDDHDLRFAGYSLVSGFKGAPATVSPDAWWVRALSGDPVPDPTCVIVAPAGIGSGQTTSPGLGFTISYLVSEHRVDVERIRMTRIRWCGDRPAAATTDLGVGSKPSIAHGRVGIPGSEAKLLVAYGLQNELWGRFLNTDGTPQSTPFLIDELPEDFFMFSTDMIWNPFTARFIIGYMGKKDVAVDVVSPELCQVKNVRVSLEGTVESPRRWGTCDAQRGHHTSAAIDIRRASNGQERYAWWYQSDSAKVVGLMASDGTPTGDVLDMALPAFTLPIAARKDDISSGGTTIELGKVSGSYVTAARVSSSDQRLATWTFDAQGSAAIIGIVGPEDAWLLATQALKDEAVHVWIDCASQTGCSANGDWAFTVATYVREPPVAAP